MSIFYWKRCNTSGVFLVVYFKTDQGSRSTKGKSHRFVFSGSMGAFRPRSTNELPAPPLPSDSRLRFPVRAELQVFAMGLHRRLQQSRLDSQDSPRILQTSFGAAVRDLEPKLLGASVGAIVGADEGTSVGDSDGLHVGPTNSLQSM